MSMDKTTDVQTVLAEVTKVRYHSHPDAEKPSLTTPMWGVPMDKLTAHLALDEAVRAY